MTGPEAKGGQVGSLEARGAGKGVRDWRRPKKARGQARYMLTDDAEGLRLGISGMKSLTSLGSARVEYEIWTCLASRVWASENWPPAARRRASRSDRRCS
jgi:hypothetical protein